VITIAKILGIDQDAVVGKLVRIWIWADQQSLASDGNCYTLSVTPAFLDRVTNCTHFADALRKVGWLAGDDESVTLPNFDRHNGQTAKARAFSARRMVKMRAKRYAERDATSVTEAQPEKRREEIDICAGSDIEPPRGWPASEDRAAQFAGHVSPEVAVKAWLLARTRGWRDSKDVPIRCSFQSWIAIAHKYDIERKAKNDDRRIRGQGVDRNSGIAGGAEAYKRDLRARIERDAKRKLAAQVAPPGPVAQ
jgi:hypothetical protein